jgi:hypothetical protein
VPVNGKVLKHNRKPYGSVMVADQGRPTYCTDAFIEAFCELIRIGNHVEPSLAQCEISVDAFWDWHKRGKDMVESDDPEFLDHQYAKLYIQYHKAVAESETVLVGYWQLHAKEDYRAARDMLARRFPQRWSNEATIRMIHEGGDAPIRVEIEHSTERMQEIARILAEVGALEGAEEADEVEGVYTELPALEAENSQMELFEEGAA